MAAIQFNIMGKMMVKKKKSISDDVDNDVHLHAHIRTLTDIPTKVKRKSTLRTYRCQFKLLTFFTFSLFPSLRRAQPVILLDAANGREKRDKTTSCVV